MFSHKKIRHILLLIYKNVGVNVGENVDVNLNSTERTIIELVLKDPTLTAEKISIKIGKTKRTA